MLTDEEYKKIFTAQKTPEQIVSEMPAGDLTEALFDTAILSYDSPDVIRQGLSPESQQALHEVDVDYGVVPRDRGNAVVEPFRQFGEKAYQTLADSVRGTAKTIEMLGGEQDGAVSNAIQRHLNRNQGLNGPQYKSTADYIFGTAGSALGSTAPAIAAAFVPYVGAPLSVAATFSRSYGDNVQRNINNGMSQGGAYGLAFLESSIDTAIEHMPWGVLGHAKGAAKVSRMRKLLNRVKNDPVRSKTVMNGIIRTLERTYGKGTEPLLKRLGKSVLFEGLGEAGEEGLQGINNRAFRSISGEKNVDWSIEPIMEEMLGGFVGGVFLGAGQHAIHGAKVGARRIFHKNTLVDDYRNYGNDINKITGEKLRSRATTEGIVFDDADSDDSIREKMFDNWLDKHNIGKYQYTSAENNVNPNATINVKPDATATPTVTPVAPASDASMNVAPANPVTAENNNAGVKQTDAQVSVTPDASANTVAPVVPANAGTAPDVNISIAVDSDLKKYGLAKTDIQKMSNEELNKLFADIADAVQNGSASITTLNYIGGEMKARANGNAVITANGVPANVSPEVQATNATGTYGVKDENGNPAIAEQSVSTDVADVNNQQGAGVSAETQDPSLAYQPDSAKRDIAPITVGNTQMAGNVHSDKTDVNEQRRAVADYKANPDKYKGKIRILTKEEVIAKYGEQSEVLEYMDYAEGIALTLGAKNILYGEYPPELNSISGEHLAGGTDFIINLNNERLAKSVPALVHTTIHEATHTLSVVAPDAFKTIKDFVINKVVDKDKYNAQLQKYIQQRGGNLDSVGAENEFICDLVGQLFRDKSFVNRIQNADAKTKSAFRKLLERIKDFLQRIIDFLDSNKNVEGIPDSFAVFKDANIDRLEEVKDFMAKTIAEVSGKISTVAENSDTETDEEIFIADSDKTKSAKPKKPETPVVTQTPDPTVAPAVAEEKKDAPETPVVSAPSAKAKEKTAKTTPESKTEPETKNKAEGKQNTGDLDLGGEEKQNTEPKSEAKTEPGKTPKDGFTETVTIDGVEYPAKKVDGYGKYFKSVLLVGRDTKILRSDEYMLIGSSIVEQKDADSFLTEMDVFGHVRLHKHSEEYIIRDMENGYFELFVKKRKGLRNESKTENKPETKAEEKAEQKTEPKTEPENKLKTAEELGINNAVNYWKGNKSGDHQERFYVTLETLQKVTGKRVTFADSKDAGIFIDPTTGEYVYKKRWYNQHEDQFRYIVYNDPAYKAHNGVVPDEYKYMVDGETETEKAPETQKQTEVKQEAKPEVAPAPAPETKAEANPETKAENAPDDGAEDAQLSDILAKLQNIKNENDKKKAAAEQAKKDAEPVAKPVAQPETDTAPKTENSGFKDSDVRFVTGAEANALFDQTEFEIIETNTTGENEGNELVDEIKVGFVKDKLAFFFVNKSAGDNGKFAYIFNGVIADDGKTFAKSADDVIDYFKNLSSKYQRMFDNFNFSKKISDAFKKQEERFEKNKAEERKKEEEDSKRREQKQRQYLDDSVKNAYARSVDVIEVSELLPYGPHNTETGFLFDKTDSNDVTMKTTDREIVSRNIKAIKILNGIKNLEDVDATNNMSEEDRKALINYIGWDGVNIGEFEEQIKNELGEEELLRIKSTKSAQHINYDIADVMWKIARNLGYDGKSSALDINSGNGMFIGCKESGGAVSAAVTQDVYSAKIMHLLYHNLRVFRNDIQNVDLITGQFGLAIGAMPQYDGTTVKEGNMELSTSAFTLAKAIHSVKNGGLIVTLVPKELTDNPKEMLYIHEFASLVNIVRLDNEMTRDGKVYDIAVFKKYEKDKDDKYGLKLNYTSWNIKEHPGFGEIKVNTMVEANAFADESIDKSVRGTMTKLNDTDYTVMRNKSYDEKNEFKEIEKHFGKGKLFTAEDGSVTDTRFSKSQIVDGIQPGELIADKSGHLLYNNMGRIERVTSLGDGGNKVGLAFVRMKDTLRDYEKTKDKSALETLSKQYDDFVGKHGYLSAVVNKEIKRDPNWFRMAALMEKSEDILNEKKNTIRRIYVKSDFFEKGLPETSKGERTEFKNDTDRINYVSILYGGINAEAIDTLAKMYKGDKDEVVKKLIQTQELFLDTNDGRIYTKTEFLQGDVRTKYNNAVRDIADEGKSEIAKKNADALQKVMHPDYTANDIDVFYSSEFVPSELVVEYFNTRVLTNGAKRRNICIDDTTRDGHGFVRKFISNANIHISEVSETSVIYQDAQKCAFDTINAKGDIVHHDQLRFVINNSFKDKPYVCGTKSISPEEQTYITSVAADIYEKLRKDFLDFVRNPKTEYQKALVKIMMDKFNERYNRGVAYTIEDAPLSSFPGANTTYTLRETQSKGLAHAITVGSLLLNHCVGSGKTIEFITLAHEMKRTGKAKKPIIVVHNSTLQQYAIEAYKLYPNANILIYDIARFGGEEGRDEFWRIASSGDYDMIICPHSTFKGIELSREQTKKVIADTLFAEESAYYGVEYSGKNLKELENEINTLARYYKRRLDSENKKSAKKKDSGSEDNESTSYKFDETGIDAILFDESHLAKKIPTSTRYSSIKGVDNASTANYGTSFYLKMQYVREMNGGKNTFTATGTPITNTLVEIYNAAKMSRPEALKIAGIENFDDFVNVYCRVTSQMEISQKGTFDSVNCINTFANLKPFHQFLALFCDNVLPRDLEKVVKVNRSKQITHKLALTDNIKEYFNILVDVAKNYSEMSPSQKSLYMWLPLVIQGLSRRGSIDLRLVCPKAYDELSPEQRELYYGEKAYKGSKIKAIVENVVKLYKQNGEEETGNPLSAEERERRKAFDGRKNCQAIFCDNHYNKANGFDVFEETKKRLIEQGIPENEIAIVTADLNVLQRQKIFDKCNTGKIRVVMGSTQTLGTGVNIQHVLSDLHHMDATYMPSEIDQRNGRIDRPGNTFANTRIHFYATERTLDSKILEMLEKKAVMILAAMDFRNTVMEAVTVPDSLPEADVIAELTGSSIAQHWAELQKQVSDLEVTKNNYDKLLESAKKKIKEAETRLEDDKRMLTYKDSLENFIKKTDKMTEESMKIEYLDDQGDTAVWKTIDAKTKTEFNTKIKEKVEQNSAYHHGRYPLYIRYNGIVMRLRTYGDYEWYEHYKTTPPWWNPMNIGILGIEKSYLTLEIPDGKFLPNGKFQNVGRNDILNKGTLMNNRCFGACAESFDKLLSALTSNKGKVIKELASSQEYVDKGYDEAVKKINADINKSFGLDINVDTVDSDIADLRHELDGVERDMRAENQHYLTEHGFDKLLFLSGLDMKRDEFIANLQAQAQSQNSNSNANAAANAGGVATSAFDIIEYLADERETPLYESDYQLLDFTDLDAITVKGKLNPEPSPDDDFTPDTGDDDFDGIATSDFMTIEQEQQLEQDRKAEAPVFGNAYAYTRTLFDKIGEFGQDIGFSNNVIGSKKDISVTSVMWKDPMHLFEKIPAAGRIFNAGQEMFDDRIRFENYIYNVSADGMDSDLKVITDLAKEDKKTYKQLSEYLVRCDKFALNGRVYQDGKYFLAFDNENDLTKFLKDKDNAFKDGKKPEGYLGSYENEEEAFDAVFADEHKRLMNGKTKGIADAVMAFRKILRRSYLAQRAHTFKEFREMNGLDENDNNLFVKIPKWAMSDDVKDTSDSEELVEVNLWDIYRDMGNRSPYYFPRLRNGKYILQAKDSKGRHIREAFASKILRAMRVRELKKQGYSDFKTDTNDRSAENIFSDVNLTTVADIVGAVSDKIDTKYGKDILAVEEWETKSGKRERDLVLKITKEEAKENRSLRKLMKEIGFGFYGDENPDSPKEKAWRVRMDKVTPEQYKRLAKMVEAMGIVTESKGMMLKNFLNVTLAEVLKQNTAHSSKLRRGDEVGDNVVGGYIEDPLTAMTQLVASTASSNARTIMAKRMYNAYAGTDIDYQIFFDKAMKSLGYTQDDVDGNIDSFLEVQEKAGKMYSKAVKDRRIDRKQQPVAAGQLNKYIKDMTRNTTEVETMLGIMKSVAAVKYLSRISSSVANFVGAVTTVPAVINSRTGVGIKQNLTNFLKGSIDYVRFMAKYKYGKGDKMFAYEDGYIFSTIHNMKWDGSEEKNATLESTKKLGTRTVNKISDVLMLPFGTVEQINRAGSIYAAFKALLQKTGTKFNDLTESQRFEMLKKAKQISDRANGVYNKGNRMMWTRGGSVFNALTEQVMLFRTFDINYLNNWAYAIRHGQIKPLIYMATINMLAGGLEASLIWSVLTALLSFFGVGGKTERGEDNHQKLYNLVEQSVSPVASRFMQYGLAGLAGVNIQGSLQSNITDIPTAITDGALFSTVKDLTFGKGLQARDLASPQKIWESSLAYDIHSGNVGRVAQRILPQVIAQPVNAIEKRVFGLRNRYGNKLKGVDGKQVKPSAYDTAVNLFTFNPAGTSGQLQKLYNEKSVKDAYSKRKKKIYQDYRAWKDAGGKDEKRLQKIQDAIKDFNTEVAESKYKDKLVPITERGLRSAVNSKAME